MNEKIYVYRIYFPESDKCYIGQTNDIKRRMVEHVSSDDSLVHRALMKHEGWKISVLHTCKSRDEANRIEIEEIRNFGSVHPNGYNLTHGGGGAGSPSEETRQKIGDSNRGKKRSEEVRKKIGDAGKGNKRALGHKHSEEARQKMRGRKHSDETRQKMSDAHKDREYPKASDTARANMSAAHKGKRYTAEQKRKMSEARTGAKRSEEGKKNMGIAQRKRSFIIKQRKIKELEQEIEQR